ncbi:putative orexin receptor type 2-like [Apostichopus japonicus]|uniref:Putative orexin receptor type 2-like n=1 Tax=Stichopus japonicus TaxID=307972 RepID=A0A2G8JYE2_STIJA|nr:putative orexin receptor type 2-like [Apostichopus japonicus]
MLLIFTEITYFCITFSRDCFISADHQGHCVIHNVETFACIRENGGEKARGGDKWRFYVVKYPLQAKAVLTFRRAKIALLIVWVFAIFFTLPNIFKQGVIPFGDIGICKVIWDPQGLENRLYVTCNMLFLLIIPVIMMTLAYVSVIRALYKNKKATAGRKQSSAGRIAATYENGASTRLQVQQNEDVSSTSTYTPDASPARSIVRDENGNKNKAKRLRFRIGGTKEPKDEDADKIRRIVLMLVIIVLLFVISWAPLLTVNFLLKFAIITPSTRTITMLSSSTHLLAFANSCFNPFVYALLSKNFRESTKQVLRQCCGGTDAARFQNRPSLSSTRQSRLGSSMPRWKSLRGANETKEDYV